MTVDSLPGHLDETLSIKAKLFFEIVFSIQITKEMGNCLTSLFLSFKAAINLYLVSTKCSSFPYRFVLRLLLK